MAGWVGVPRTFADGDVIRASALMQELFDRMIVISGHDHTGATGDGAVGVFVEVA